MILDSENDTNVGDKAEQGAWGAGPNWGWIWIVLPLEQA